MDLNFNLKPSEEGETDYKTVALESNQVYDVLIIGGGPAGLTAAVYCMRKGVNTALVADEIGGQVSSTTEIENYMGYMYIEGDELVEKFEDQVKQFEIAYQEGSKVTSIKNGEIKEITLENGNTYQAKSVIVAAGKSSRKLNCPGEDKLIGKGVAYCAICDAPLYKDKDVVIVGGGNSAVEAAIDLAKIANDVTLLEIEDHLNADQILIDRLNEFDNVNILLEHSVQEIQGESKVENIVIENHQQNINKEITAQGIFIEIGWIPNTNFVKDTLELNDYNEIKVDCKCRTNQEGIFAAGDITNVPFKQIIIASGEGAKAALSACDYVLKS